MASSERPRYALITGCTPGGIGHFLALEFAAKGFQVLGTVRNPSKYTSPNANITYLPLELTSNDSIRELRERVAEITNGNLHILYNNAGRNYVVPALDYDEDELHELFQANVFSVMKICAEFTPLLVKTKGTIVQTGSVAGIMPYVWGAPYNASKAALHAYSDTLRVELAPLGVRVITVVTGGVKSNIARTHRVLPPNSYMQPLAADYERRLTHSQQVGMDTQQYARSCVRQVLGGDGWFGKRRWIWEGNMSWIVWFAWTYLPVSAMDYYFTSKFKLNKLIGTAGPDKKDSALGDRDTLFTLGLCAAAGFMTMNIIRELKDLRRGSKSDRENRTRLSKIPKSRLTGIHALPAELWGLIIEYVVAQRLNYARLPFWDLLDTLEMRLVCHVFDNEVQRALHQQLTISQLPHVSMMRALSCQPSSRETDKNLHLSLLASALCNSSRSSLRHTQVVRIADRIRNCATIASHITAASVFFPYSGPSFFFFCSGADTKTLMEKLCYAASTSKYCQQYMYMQSDYARMFRSYAEGDAYLEAALLVACGYPIEKVKSWMVRLAKGGKLVRYRTGAEHDWERDRVANYGHECEEGIDCVLYASAHE